MFSLAFVEGRAEMFATNGDRQAAQGWQQKGDFIIDEGDPEYLFKVIVSGFSRADRRAEVNHARLGALVRQGAQWVQPIQSGRVGADRAFVHAVVEQESWPFIGRISHDKPFRTSQGTGRELGQGIVEPRRSECRDGACKGAVFCCRAVHGVRSAVLVSHDDAAAVSGPVRVDGAMVAPWADHVELRTSLGLKSWAYRAQNVTISVLPAQSGIHDQGHLAVEALADA